MSGINGYSGFLSNIVQGDTKDFRIAVTLNSVAVDITGGKFYLTIDVDVATETAPTLEIEITTLTDPTNGITVGSISDSDTMDLPVGTLYYSLRYINADGKAYILDMGKIKCKKGISSRVV